MSARITKDNLLLWQFSVSKKQWSCQQKPLEVGDLFRYITIEPSVTLFDLFKQVENSDLGQFVREAFHAKVPAMSAADTSFNEPPVIFPSRLDAHEQQRGAVAEYLVISRHVRAIDPDEESNEETSGEAQANELQKQETCYRIYLGTDAFERRLEIGRPAFSHLPFLDSRLPMLSPPAVQQLIDDVLLLPLRIEVNTDSRCEVSGYGKSGLALWELLAIIYSPFSSTPPYINCESASIEASEVIVALFRDLDSPTGESY